MGERAIAGCRIALLLWVLVFAAGCELSADVVVDVDRDGAGAMSVALAIDEELAARADEAELDVFAPLRAAAADDPAWTAEGDARATTVRMAFAGPAELARRSAALADDLAAEELVPLAPLRVTVSDDRIVVEGGAALDLTAAVADLGFAEPEAERALAEAVDYTVRISVPGEVLEASDGGRVEGAAVAWTVPAGEEVALRVVSTRPARLAPWVWVVGAVVLTAVVVGAAWWMRRRRRRRPRPA